MSRPRIKMCGITTISDGRDAVRAGADLLGMVFYARSPRAVNFAMAGKIAEIARSMKRPKHAASSDPVQIVAVFVNPVEELVEGVVRAVGPDILQFHGGEPPELCESYGYPYMKAHRLASARDAARIGSYLKPPAVGYLIDAFVRGVQGGTGRVLATDLIRAGLESPGGFLAGGLNAGNVGALVRQFRPAGVDVSSGIENRPGRKNARLMRAFAEAVAEAAAE